MKGKVLMLIMGVLLLAGCGSSKDAMVTDTSTATEGEAPKSEDYGQVMEDVLTEEEAGESSDDIADTDAMTNEEPQKQSATEEKYIQTYYYDTETLEFSESLTQLSDIVSRYNGYFESSSITGSPILDENPENRRAEYIIRIPLNEVDAFIEKIEEGKMLHIRDVRSEKENVTNQYTDISARLKTLELQEDRLIAILEDADELEYVLQLERELSDVRYDIERYTSSIRQLDNKINYITIHMSIREVYEVTPREETPRTFSERLSIGFSESVEQLKDFFVNTVLWIMTRSPLIITYLVAFGLVFVIGLNVWRRIKKRTKNHSKEE